MIKSILRFYFNTKYGKVYAPCPPLPTTKFYRIKKLIHRFDTWVDSKYRQKDKFAWRLWVITS
ncbi:MAG: hypothetical protein GY861_01655 [bacterium]|nr:hypothetical protein [bacterium]